MPQWGLYRKAERASSHLQPSGRDSTRLCSHMTSPQKPHEDVQLGVPRGRPARPYPRGGSRLASCAHVPRASHQLFQSAILKYKPTTKNQQTSKDTQARDPDRQNKTCRGGGCPFLGEKTRREKDPPPGGRLKSPEC